MQFIRYFKIIAFSIKLKYFQGDEDDIISIDKMADSSSLDRSSSYCTIEHGGRKKGQLYGSTSTATPTQTEEVSALSVSSVVSGKLKRSYKSYLEPSSSTSSSTSTSSNSSSTSPLAAVPRSLQMGASRLGGELR